MACATASASVWGGAIAINNTQALAFGKFSASSGSTVTVSTSGARTPGFGVMLLSSGAGAAAQFLVTGDSSRTYSITLPVNGTVSLSLAGSPSMNVINFISSPSTTGTLSVGDGTTGSQTLMVGATLNVGNSQPTGIYSGSFSVTVDYN